MVLKIKLIIKKANHPIQTNDMKSRRKFGKTLLQSGVKNEKKRKSQIIAVAFGQRFYDCFLKSVEI